LVALAVVVYRFAIALAAPVWLARSASAAKQRLAVAVPLAGALLGQVGLKTFNLASQANQAGYQLNALDFAATIWAS